MEFHLSSFLWYIGVLVLSYIFASRAERSKNDNKRRWNFFVSYLIVVSFCALRFFVGNDYYNYYASFNLIQKYEENVLLWEPGYYYLNLLFSYSDIGYLYVIGICSVITFSFLFAAVWNKGNLKYGVICIVALGILIFVNDAIRQGVALSICIWSTRFIESNEKSRFVLSVLLAVMFHYTSVIFFVALFLKKIKIPWYMWYVLLFTVLILQLTGFAEKTYRIIMSYVPLYGEGYLDKDQYSTTQRFGLSILYRYILALPFIAYINRFKDENVLVNLYLGGLLLNGLFFGFMNFERIAMYFYFAQILVYPVFLKKFTMRPIIIVIIVSYFSLQSLLALEKHGAVPYRTLFYENLINPPYEEEIE